jgi:hypothetical protein
VGDNHPLNGQKPTARRFARISAAFELPRDTVLADAALVTEWLRSEQALLEHLRAQHDWDDSMAPYYVFWLRGV